MKKILIAVTTFAICTGMVMCALAGSKSTSDAFTHEHINRSTITPVPKSEVVMAGNVQWNILNVEEVGPVLRQKNTGSTLETRGKFVNIRFEVVNLGEDQKYIFDLRMVDERGRTYPICAKAYAYLGLFEEACSVAELIPDMKRTFTTSHDVPKNAEDLWFEVTDLNVPPEEKLYIDLGI
jgi:hypothetical protein